MPSPDPHRQRARLVAVLGAAVLMLVVAASAAIGQRSSTVRLTGTAFGTLNAEIPHAGTEAADGLRVATVELSWARAEPSPGSFDNAYISSISAWASHLRSAGLTVTLSLGMHYTPSWVLALPDGRYVDEVGDTSGEADFVFSESVRDAAAAYISHLGGMMGFGSFAGVRLTSGGDAELLYPSGGHYWAFSSGAQNGSDAPSSLSPNPLPGWIPGTPGHTASEVTAWLRWYVDGLDNVADWEMTTLRSAGFNGHFDLVTPGSGVRPDAIAALADNDLPPGLAGVGAVWQWVYADLAGNGLLAPHPDVEAYISSVADGSGGDDSCQVTDLSVPVTSASADGWSATRWISHLADTYGYAKGGENPGYNPAASAHYTDSGKLGLAAAAVRQALSCNFRDFFWAHDNEFWDGVLPLATYLQWIPGATLPPLSPALLATSVKGSKILVTVSSAHTSNKTKPTGTVRLSACHWTRTAHLVKGKVSFTHKIPKGCAVTVTYAGDKTHKAAKRILRLTGD